MFVPTKILDGDGINGLHTYGLCAYTLTHRQTQQTHKQWRLTCFMHNMNVFYTYIYNVQRTEYIILKHITYIIIEIHKESGQHMWVMLSVAIRDYYVHKAAEYENVTTVSGAPELRWMWREDNSHENDRVKGTKKKNICPVWWSHVDDVRACVCMWFDVMLFFLLFFLTSGVAVGTARNCLVLKMFQLRYRRALYGKMHGCFGWFFSRCVWIREIFTSPLFIWDFTAAHWKSTSFV